MYPRFSRFECKHFLTQAIAYFGGAAAQCMVDNSNVVVAAGSGAQMVPAPEMAAFAERYGFVFKAHAIGDANRSARVEAHFHRIERAFLPGAALHQAAQMVRQSVEIYNQERPHHALQYKTPDEVHRASKSSCYGVNL